MTERTNAIAQRAFDRWDRIDVSDWEVIQVEPAGSNSVLWIQDPDTGLRWLHKSTTIPSNGVEQGEDWAEVVSTRVAELLGVPCAQTRLCSRHGRRGSLSLDVTPPGYDLNEGSAVLEAAQVPGYFPHREGQPGVDPARPGIVRPGHSLANIKGVLIDKLPPDDFAGPSLNGFDVFVGYVILDALIANRDRHEQNWAVLTSRLLNQVDRLAPSYDHGGSLGYNLPDGERRRRVDDPAALLRWAEGGTAWRFEHQRRRPLSLVELAQDGITLCTPEAAEWWVRRIGRLDLGPVVSALEHGVPGMSVAAATFVIKLLDLNRRRLLHAICPA